LAADEDETVRAAALFAEALQLHAKDGEQMGVMFCLLGLGKLAAVNDSLPFATLLLGAAEALRDERGVSLPQDHRAPYEGCMMRLRAGLDELQFTALWEEGRTLALDQTVERAATLAATLARQASSTAVADGSLRPGNLSMSGAAGSTMPLSPREREVLRLIVAGQSDRQIAETLFISHRTAQGHVAHIFDKLGVNSRTAAATTAIRLGLVAAPVLRPPD
jgi:non-specific serine/threonine protein kinase